MGYKMIEIDCEKKEELAENIEKTLHYAGRAMSCVEQMCDEAKMGYRRSGMGYRDDEDDDMMGERMGYRRGVKGTGPYSRYGRRMGYRDEFRDPILY